MRKKHTRKGKGLSSRRIWMGFLCLVMTGAVVMQNSVIPRREAYAAQAASMTPPVAAAYVMDSAGLKLRQGDAPYLTQINYAFALIEEGKVTGSHWQGIKAFEGYIERNPHILPIMAVGGWGADGFSQAAAGEESRKVFVQSALQLMERHGFRGIDIDWEYPGLATAGIKASEKDGENYILLLRELRKALDSLTAQDGVKRYLSVALGAAPETTQAIDLKAVGAIADQVNVMTYDLMGFDKTTGHHANLYAYGDETRLSGAKAVEDLAAKGIPKEKIMLGAAAYGRCWRQVQGGDGLGRRAGTSGNKIYTYRQIKEMMADYQSHWDDEAQAPYLFDGSRFISYEDPRSVSAKGEYARKQGLMGVVLWEYSKDDGDLVKALFDGLQ